MAAPVIGWATKSILSKLGIGISVEVATKIASILAQRENKTVEEYDTILREQSIKNLIETSNELKNTLYFVGSRKPELKRSIFLIRKLFEVI